MSHRRVKCAAEGCEQMIEARNKSGLCLEHYKIARLAGNREASKLHTRREREQIAARKHGGRYTVCGHVRGCHTSVTADTAEDARRLLEAMQ